MLLGEMLVYDFGLMDSAANRYKELIKLFPDSKFAPRAMYALTFYSEDSLRWKNEFSEKYPNPAFLIESIDESSEKMNEFSSQRQLILNQLDVNPHNTRDSLISFFNVNNDADALYFSAYISDYNLNEIDFSKEYYKHFIDSFPDHEHFTKAKSRYESIEQSILDTFPEIIDTTEFNNVLPFAGAP